MQKQYVPIHVRDTLRSQQSPSHVEEYVNPCGNIVYKRKLGCLQSRFYFTPQEMVGLGYASELAFSLKGLRLLPSFLPEAHIYGAGDWRVIIGSEG